MRASSVLSISLASTLISVSSALAGLGLRGPPGFYHAVLAARGDAARGAALTLLGIMGAAAVGTAIAPPFVAKGLVQLAAIALVLHVLAMACLMLLPKLSEVST